VQLVETSSERLTTAINDRRNSTSESQITNDSAQEIRTRLAQYQGRVGELEGILPALEESEAAEIAAARAQSEARAVIDSKTTHMSLRRKDLDVRMAGLQERQQFLRQRCNWSFG
jgi:chromosome segregation protein